MASRPRIRGCRVGNSRQRTIHIIPIDQLASFEVGYMVTNGDYSLDEGQYQPLEKGKRRPSSPRYFCAAPISLATSSSLLPQSGWP